jgi:hypothetical protein
VAGACVGSRFVAWCVDVLHAPTSAHGIITAMTKPNVRLSSVLNDQRRGVPVKNQ